MNAADAVKPPPWALIVAFGIIYTSWGTTYYAIKLGVQDEHLPPLLFGGSRIFLAGVLVMAWQMLRAAPLRITWRDVLRYVAVSLLLFVAGNGFIGYGQKRIDSSVAAVLVATTPLWIGLFATLWPHGEHLTGRGWLGLLIGLGGVVVLISPKLLVAERTFDLAGLTFVMGSSVSWAVGSVLLRHMRVNLPHLTAAGYQMLVGGATMLAVGGALGEHHDLPDHVTSGAVYVFTYLLIVGSLGGFLAFNWLLGHVSAAKVGTYAYVNPLVAVLIGWAVGEDVSWELWGGMAVILFGVFLVRGGEKHEAKHEAPSEPLPDQHEDTTCASTNAT